MFTFLLKWTQGFAREHAYEGLLWVFVLLQASKGVLDSIVERDLGSQQKNR